MNAKEHTEEVAGKAVEKKADSPFRCDNCGATFVSESEKRAHQESQHEEEHRRRAG